MRRLPSWLILLLLGILLGAGGVLMLQSSYGPKRLTTVDSQKLTDELNSATLERQRIQTKLDEQTRLLERAREETDKLIKPLKDELAAATALIDPLKEQLSAFIQTLPFDARFGPIGISTANFFQEKAGIKLTYLIWLLQEKADRPVVNGQLEISFEGGYLDGRNETITLPRQNFKLGHYLHITGQTEVPRGFTARKTNVRLFDTDGKRQITWRVFPVIIK